MRDAAAAQRAGAVGSGRIGGEISRSVDLDEAAAVPAWSPAAGADGCAAVGTCDLQDRVARIFQVASRSGAAARSAAQLEAAHAAR